MRKDESTPICFQEHNYEVKKMNRTLQLIPKCWKTAKRRLYEKYKQNFCDSIQITENLQLKYTIENLIYNRKIKTYVQYKETTYDKIQCIIKYNFTYDEALEQKFELFKIYQFSILRPKLFITPLSNIQNDYYDYKRRKRAELLRRALEKMADSELDRLSLSYLEKYEISKDCVMAYIPSNKPSLLKQIGLIDINDELKTSFALSISIIEEQENQTRMYNEKPLKSPYKKTVMHNNKPKTNAIILDKTRASTGFSKIKPNVTIFNDKTLKTHYLDTIKLPLKFQENPHSPRKSKNCIPYKAKDVIKTQRNKLYKKPIKKGFLKPSNHETLTNNIKRTHFKPAIKVDTCKNTAFTAQLNNQNKKELHPYKKASFQSKKIFSSQVVRFSLSKVSDIKLKCLQSATPKTTIPNFNYFMSNQKTNKYGRLSNKNVANEQKALKTPKTTRLSLKRFDKNVMYPESIVTIKKRFSERFNSIKCRNLK